MSNNPSPDQKKRTKPGIWEEHWPEIILTALAVLAIHAVFLPETYRGDSLDPTKAGQFGDFIGGYVGTIVLVVSVGLLCASFRNQRRTNERTAFETRFFELLKFHRENVSEIGIGSTLSGRRVFVSLIREFRECLKIVDDQCAALSIPRTTDQKLDLAYLAFYYGVGPNSSRVLKKAVDHHPVTLVTAVMAKLEDIQKAYRNVSEKMADQSTHLQERVSYENFRQSLTRVSYSPFDGHQSRLGHYYRHLFQVMKYVKAHAPENTAREYAGIVRAQLTNHEQALLCLNALSEIGKPWLTTGILENYAMIKNIPRDFFDPVRELDLEKRFPTIEFEFKTDHAADEPNRTSTAPGVE